MKLLQVKEVSENAVRKASELILVEFETLQAPQLVEDQLRQLLLGRKSQKLKII